jgi:hypothetical protein
MEHKEVIALEAQGKLLIGVDRAMARKFYTDIPISKIEEETGEAPYFEKAIIWFAFLFGPIALISSIIFGFVAFGWWGIICLVLCPIIYFMYSSSSVVGGSQLIGITVLLLISLAVHFLANFNFPWITGFASTYLFSLWCVRLLYCSSTFLLRAFVLRNAKAFEWLSEYLVIKQNE